MMKIWGMKRASKQEEGFVTHEYSKSATKVD